MAYVRVTCLLCEHPVEVRAADVTLHLGEPAPKPVDRYGFTCPDCGVFVVRRANQQVVEALVGTFEIELATGELAPWEQSLRPDVLLSDAGATRTALDTPPVATAPALTESDLMTFTAMLDDDDALAAWLDD